MKYLTGVALLLLLACSTLTPVHARSATASKEATDYLNFVLDYIQANSVNSDKLNWPQIRQEAMSRIQNARTTADTYPTIRWLLEQLGDHHSFFLDPQAARKQQHGHGNPFGLRMTRDGIITDILPDSPADASGQIRRGDVLTQINGFDRDNSDAIRDSLKKHPGTATLTLTRNEQPYTVTLALKPYESNKRPWGKLVQPDIGYIELPAVIGGTMEQHYADIVHDEIRKLDQQYTIKGWIIDLRNNTGGNCWPMLAGIGPILGEGKLGAFVSHGKEVGTWMYQEGKAMSDDYMLAQVQQPYRLKQPLPPVAVLTSNLTASSGEAVAIAFHGRPSTRFFGESTYGLPTANTLEILSDGAQLYLTVANDADRTGQVYEEPIAPDQEVSINWAELYTEQDNVIKAAQGWLQQ
uniref:PDZ domain-containing protein n=1 Tax=Thermosporothrix sp. COM3 TaxID=2490863 RepID=A0A455SKC4_9CHLR|nr:hypothetical protein KTC_13560 [Thermosporothrix sp. COM3]